MSLKKTIKRILPARTVAWVSGHRTGRSLKRLTKAESARFLRNYASPNAADDGQVEARLVFYVHQIEKGFTYDEYSYGRGREALRNIADLMHRLTQAGVKLGEDPAAREAILALGEYRRRHEAAGKTDAIGFMESLFPPQVNKVVEKASRKEYPSIELTLEGKKDNAAVPFAELTERRHAIRSYSDQPVTRKELEDAVEGALRTPSVCNRQPTRIRIIQDKDTIAKALKIQGGFGGYATPPALLVVTSDLRVFMGVNEHNEAYTDGGLFAMSLLYSLEAHSLAACPLNTMFNPRQEKQTRALLHIPDNEVFVMYIAVGHFKPTNRICRSQRFTLDRILLD